MNKFEQSFHSSRRTCCCGLVAVNEMKFTLCMIGCLVVVLGHVRADPEPVTPDTRKARHPVNGPSNYNSISVPDSETLSKLQNQVAPSVQQIPLKPIGLPTKSSEVGQAYSVTPGPLNSQYVPTTSNQNLNQYYMAMATPHGTGNQVLAPGRISDRGISTT